MLKELIVVVGKFQSPTKRSHDCNEKGADLWAETESEFQSPTKRSHDCNQQEVKGTLRVYDGFSLLLSGVMIATCWVKSDSRYVERCFSLLLSGVMIATVAISKEKWRHTALLAAPKSPTHATFFANRFFAEKPGVFAITI